MTFFLLNYVEISIVKLSLLSYFFCQVIVSFGSGMEITGDVKSTTNDIPQICIESCSEYPGICEEFNREETEQYIKRRDLEQNASPSIREGIFL